MLVVMNHTPKNIRLTSYLIAVSLSGQLSINQSSPELSDDVFIIIRPNTAFTKHITQMTITLWLGNISS